MLQHFARLFVIVTASVGLTACGAEGQRDDATIKDGDQANITLIHGAQILTMNENFDIIDDGTIVIADGEIIAIGDATLNADYTDATIINADGAIALPGMINLHNHLSMVAFRGIAETGITDIQQRLFDYFFPLEKNLLNRELIRISARHAAIEMAIAGVTTTTDMYYHEDEVAKSVKEVGMRGILGQTVIGFPVVDAPEPFGGYEYAQTFIKEWIDDPLITPAFAPHAPYTVPEEILRKVKASADEHGVPILMHMAELPNEPAFIDQTFPGTLKGRSVVEYLDDIGFLGDNLISAHTIFVSPSDIALLKANNVGVAHNPKANTKDMSGLSPAVDMFDEGLDIGLGTDGPMSSNQLDILSVMPFAIRVGRILKNDVSRYNPRDIVEMATIGGAKALNMEEKIGSLEIGKRADLILIETTSPNMQPNYNPYATIVLSAYPHNITMTMVDGRIIARDGVIQSVDMDEHQAEWDGVVERVAAFYAELKAGRKFSD